MIECVVNVSEGRNPAVLAALRAAAGEALLDLHCDEHHNRSVLTMIGVDAVREVAAEAVRRLDLAQHVGVHPRFGVVDVVPFVALAGSTPAQALAARNAYAEWSAAALGVPCFRYGPERSLPEVRRGAFTTLHPDSGPAEPHPTAGATAVGQRRVLVAYNLWLHDTDLATARRIAASVRGPAVRTLGLAVGDHSQVSMNLIAPDQVGPEEVYDQVAALAAIERAELVGLVPNAVLKRSPSHRWSELDLAEDRTIEARLDARGTPLT
jgi:glutamate formiminotransferase / 5-formyltetrahydrofolate cyclo-ligase